ncbi:MAG TPA: branched-chain amino acid ABC transporter permease, partial [Acidimicrobiia bacterium]
IAFGIILATTLSGSDLLTYNKVFALSIVALSLVPLIGYGGQISLCQMSFAGIGAIVVAHLGATGNPLALVYAVVIAAAVGALVALPALRLSGIYLALGTAAFALILDRWIFTMPKLTVFGLFSVSSFNQGSVDVQPIKLFGDAIASPASQMVFGAIVFALVALFVTAIRRGRLGRRLLAMKDSEAACATLGLNLLGTKLLVFAISAGIAGLGGGIYGMQLGSINPTYFSLVQSLQVFALAVVGGIGAVGGALFAGVSLALVLPLLAALFPSLNSWIPLLPGGAGIALGRNPNGAVDDMRQGFLPLYKAKGVLIATLVLMAVVYALRLADVIANWPFVILMVGIPMVATGVAGFVQPTTLETEEELRAPEVPLEWRGIDEPWTAEDLDELDRVVGLSEVELHGAS